MPDKNENISYSQKLGNLILACKIHKDDKDKSEITHTCMGKPYGSYNLDNDYDEFMKLYTKTVLKENKKVHFVERPTEISPLLIDIDWHFTTNKRQYSIHDTKYIIEKTNDILKKYYKTKSKIKAFLFEKKKPTKKIKIVKNDVDIEEEHITYKDGFHIVYPELALSTKMRYLILEDLKEVVDNDNPFKNIPYTNNDDDVIDTCVVKNNGWMMYRSSKKDSLPYMLSRGFDYKLLELDLDEEEYQEKKRPTYFSVRKFRNENELKIKAMDEEELHEFEQKLSLIDKKYINKTKTKKKKEPQNIDEQEDMFDNNDIDHNDKNKTTIELAKKLTKILDPKRAESYKDWIVIGWTLHNISYSLCKTWKLFSQQCKSKYDSYACDNMWNNMKNDGYSIRTLHYYAKLDNPKKYVEIIRETIRPIIKEAESGTDYDLAKVVYGLFKNEFVCAEMKKTKTVWYHFQDHRWVMIEDGHTLRTKISEQLVEEFFSLMEFYINQRNIVEGMEKDMCSKRIDNINNLIKQLKSSAKKNKIMDESRSMFYDKNFIELLDDNKDLLGFENGIYDLKNNIFRPGTPDDYITLSVGYNYKEYSMSHEYVLEIEKLFQNMHTESIMKNYILTLISSYLDGYTKKQQCIIWTGCGSNGKSITVTFIDKLLGEYSGVLPITFLTRKQGSSGAASPELAETHGKRFVVFQEPENDDKLYVGRMKEISGGDKIQTRKLFGDPFYFRPQFKLLLTCNRLPHIPSTDGGTWRRLRVTPWESEFLDHDQKIKNPKKQFYKDFNLNDKFEDLKSAFMWLLIHKYYKDYIKFGVREPPKVKEFTNKYKKDSDVYLEFMIENINVTKKNNDKISLSDIYKAFKEWYRESYTNSSCPAKKELKDYFVNNEYTMKSNYIFGVKYKETDVENFEDAMENIDSII